MTNLQLEFNFLQFESIFSIDAVKPEDAGVYSVLVTNKLGEVRGLSIVKVDPRARKPVFIKDLNDTNVIEGFPLRLDVKYIGHPEPHLKWSVEGRDITPDNAYYKMTQSPDGRASLIIQKAKPEGEQKNILLILRLNYKKCFRRWQVSSDCCK